MSCEHPTCRLEAKTICKYHCYLSVCHQHRTEHEQILFNEFEKHLNDLSNPLSILLNKTQLELKQSEESRQNELNQINLLFDQHLSSIDKRLKLTETTNKFLTEKREQLSNCKNGDYQLIKEDYQQIESFLTNIQENLKQQYQLNNQIRDQSNGIHTWTIDKENNPSNEIECIALSDSDDDAEENLSDHEEHLSDDNQVQSDKKRPSNKHLLRDYCPLTQYGVFGLNRSHNLTRLCSQKTNKPRILYIHFTRYHSIKPRIAWQLVKAVGNGLNPMKTIIFPQDNTSIVLDNIQCPFDDKAKNLTKTNSIPNTPCNAIIKYYSLKSHLLNMHSITKLNASLIVKAMKNNGTINRIKFQGDLCEK